ncbi:MULTISPECIES: hypothetical protein [unclassified Facklamia]|uniref:hypothetical protein n=1 Tax=Aerococcaceae TaxID=186827 RepID=UPI0013BDFC1A|nr:MULTISPECIES: hypothetical protein [unclassified Facklamia]NEW64272.1 hypothetical protein [Facklamia sp. 252]NEW68787.1 hypothetical protein [Facklamia sp. 253]QQD64738.1 hypothetical protein JDW14_05210 [Aerococcaceae bacterium zg-252]
MCKALSVEYVNEQIEEWGKIEEYDDGISYCPYCGYAHELDCEDWHETFEDETQCCECGKSYLESIELDCRRYTTTKRLEVVE